jgi:DNA-binding LytR/AlgR family response regulator
MNTVAPKAIVADDEPALRHYLKTLLAEAWPELEICAEAGNGVEVVELVQAHRPQIVFLDIRMPGLSGLQAAERLTHGCHIVFVTAYDEYAVSAFEKEAADYLLKPVTGERLARTVARLRKQLAIHGEAPAGAMPWLQALLDKVQGPPSANYLEWLRVQHGDGVRLVPVREVVYFQAGNKYTAAITRDGEHLIRKAIRDLAAELDPNCFRQIHRATIVNLAHIAKISPSLTGRGIVRLKHRSETLTVSRAYLHLFKQM